MTHICFSKLTIIGSDNGLSPGWRQAIIWSSEPMLEYYIVNSKLRNKLQWNLNRNSYIFIQENTFENVVCEMVAILSRPQCVEMKLSIRSCKISRLRLRNFVRSGWEDMLLLSEQRPSGDMLLTPDIGKTFRTLLDRRTGNHMEKKFYWSSKTFTGPNFFQH